MEHGPQLPAELVDAVVRMRPAAEWMLVCHATRAMVERAAGLYAFMRRDVEPVDVSEYGVVRSAEEIGADAREKERKRVRESRAIAREFRDAVAATLAGPDPRASIECVVRPALARLVALQDERLALWTKQHEALIVLYAAKDGFALQQLGREERRAPHALHPLRRLRQLVAESFGRAGVASPEAVSALLPPRPVPRWRRRVIGVRCSDRDSLSEVDISFEEHARRRPGNIRTKVEIAFVRGLARAGRWSAAAERLTTAPELGEVMSGTGCGGVCFSGGPARLRLGSTLADAVRARTDRPPPEVFARIAAAMIGFRFGDCDESPWGCRLPAAGLCARIGRAAGNLAPPDAERVGLALEGWLSTCRCVVYRVERIENALDPDERRMGMLAFWTECARAAADPEIVELCCRAGGMLLPIAGRKRSEFERPARALLDAASFLVLSPPTSDEGPLRAAAAACDLAAALGADPLLALFAPSGGRRRPIDPPAEAAERLAAWACGRWSLDSVRTAEVAARVPAGSYGDAWDARAHPVLLMEECAAHPHLMKDRDRVERLIARCAGEPLEWWRDRVVRPICAAFRSQKNIIACMGCVGCCLRLLRPDLFAALTLEADMCCEGGCPICEHRRCDLLVHRKLGDSVSFAFGLPGEEVHGKTEIGYDNGVGWD